MSTFAMDVGVALRSLRKNPGFAITAIGTLALGIGASSAIFSVVNAVLLRPLPYEEPDRLAIVWNDLRNRNVTNFPVSGGDYRDLLEQGTLFSALAAVQTTKQPITDEASKPEIIRSAFVTSNFFSVVGLRAAIGRTFVESDGTPQPQLPPGQNVAPPQPGSPAAQAQPPRLPVMAMLSHGFWQRRYGGDSSIIGRSIRMGNATRQVVGILEPGAELLFPPKANIERIPDVWTAMRADFSNASRIDHGLRVVGRLKPGATFAAAQAQVDRLGADLRERFPIKNTSGLHFRVEPMHLDVVRTVQRPLVLLLGAVGFVLLIACANVANLLLVRASARERELAVRSALGGSRWALVRQMLSESLLLAVIGAGLGLLIAQAGIDLLAAVAPTNLPRLDGVRIDAWVFAFSLGLSFLSAIVFGLVPALRASRPNVADVLRGGRAPSQIAGTALRNGVVVAEVALSFVLLVGSGLMLRSFIAVAKTDPGFNADGALTFTLQNTRPRGRDEAAAFLRQAREKIASIPGVTAVTSASALPLDGSEGSGRWVTHEQAHDEQAFRQAQYYFVHPGYFAAMGTKIIAGRELTDADVLFPPQIPPGTAPDQAQAIMTAFQQTPRSIVVDEQLAARLGRVEDAVGKRIMARSGSPTMTPFEIVGVARHQRHTTLVGEERESIYFADDRMNGRWVVRGRGSAPNLLPQIRQALAEVDPLVPIAEVAPLNNFVDRAMAPTRFALVMLAIFAGIAVVLASVGLYGVLASAVRQRTAEIGVRMAFGAPSASIFKLVIGQGMRLSVIGVAIGAGAALLMTGALKTMLVGVTRTDPVTFAAIATLFIGVAALACWVPARRAAALDPNVALREE